LPEVEQTSKHGGGGRYNAILEFKGEQKNEKEKEIIEKIKMMSIKKKRKK
jgi:hypothetical protein